MWTHKDISAGLRFESRTLVSEIQVNEPLYHDTFTSFTRSLTNQVKFGLNIQDFVFH